MRKLDIFHLNGVWQIGRLDEVDEEHDEDLPLLEEHIQSGKSQPSIPHDVQMLTQIWDGIKNIQESMTTTRLDNNTCYLILIFYCCYLIFIFYC